MPSLDKQIPLSTLQNILDIKSDVDFEQILSELPAILRSMRQRQQVDGLGGFQWPVQWRRDGGASTVTTHCTDGSMLPVPLVAPSKSTADELMEGSCHHLAVALHRAFGFQLMLLTDSSSDVMYGNTPAIHHVLAVTPDGLAIDALGGHPASDVATQWEFDESGDGSNVGSRKAVYLEHEAELSDYVSDGWCRPLTLYTEQQIEHAMVFAKQNLMTEFNEFMSRADVLALHRVRQSEATVVSTLPAVETPAIRAHRRP